MSLSEPSLTVIILTKNEEVHLERALKSVMQIPASVIVIDSFSTDQTVAIAEAYHAIVLQHEFENYARQFQWALDNAPVSSTWVMRLDADEIIEQDLAAEIRAKLPNLASSVVGVNLKRKHIFSGRWIKHGGRYPLILLRIWRWGHGRIENRWMDEHVIVWGGDTVTFDGGFADVNLNDLTFFTAKHNMYATREALDVLNQTLLLFPRDETLSAESTSLQAALKRLAKERIYNRLPFQLSALCYFVYRYVFQLGFLDGKEGLIYHFLQGFWYRFLVGAKVHELRRSLAGVSKPDEVLTTLSKLTHLRL